MTNQTHSQEFIDEMKALLAGEQEEIKENLKTFTHQSHGDYQADFPDYGRNDEDNATEIADHTAAVSREGILEQRLKDIKSALNRITDNTYGLTEDGQEIPEERLRVNPAATTLVE